MNRSQANADLRKKTITFQTTTPPSSRYPFFNPTTLIPAECEVSFIPTRDGIARPEEAYTRVAKYIPGMKSIWKDEWTELDQSKRARSLKLSFGFISVDARDKNLLDYLRYSGYNIANDETRINSSVLYKELNYEHDAKKIVEDERKLEAAKNFVLNAPIGEVRAIALALATTKARVEEIHNQDEYTLRYSLRGVAQNDPDAFLGNMKGGASKNKVIIVKALQAKIINADDVEGYISWAKNDEIIVESPPGVDPIEHFADLSVSNDKYKVLIRSIKDLLNESNGKSPVVEKAKDLTDIMIDLALEKKIMTEKGSWFIIPSKEKDEDPLFKTQGRRKLKVAIADNEDGVRDLLSEVYK